MKSPEEIALLSEKIEAEIKKVTDRVSDLSLFEWLMQKREALFERGIIHRYNIIDTYSYEWNALRDREAEFISGCEVGISAKALKTLGVKHVVKIFGGYWLIRFNA